MDMELRGEPRFKDIGRVACKELCALTGILDDISTKGCKVHFSCSVSVDMESDYDLTLIPAHSIHEGFSLIAHPCWYRNIGEMTEIGFRILRSPDTAKYENYIKENYGKKNDDPQDMGKWLD